MKSLARLASGLLIAVAAFFMGVPPVFSQADTTQISGFVKDATSAVIPGATVTVTNEATGLAREIQTNENGYYVVSALPPGFYTVEAEAEGFKRTVQTNNKLDASIAASVEIVLEVGSVAESIEVTAQAISLQSETATVGRLVDSTQIENIVLNGRNPLFLALLKPGVRGGSLAGFSFGLTSGGFSINGSRTQDNVIQMDGAINMRTRANGTSVGVADVETVQEMQVLTANYNAEYGRTNGGMIRMVTKSGTSQFHGAAYEYFRNDQLDANTWQRNRSGLDREANRFNQFGYVGSGPVYIPGKWNSQKNKLFWLWSQEWVKYRREITSTIVVPSLAMRTGDFSELLDASNSFFGRARAITDPESGQPFANNVIPQARLSRNGAAFLSTFPEPTAGFLQGRNNFIQTRPQPSDQRKDTISIDYNPIEAHSFRFRLQNYNFFEPEAFRGGTDRAVRTIDRPNRTYTLNHIWTVSPTWINEFLASVSYDRVYLEVPVTPRLDRNTYGIDYPYIFPERKEIGIKIPTINIANFQGIDGGPYPASSSGPIYQASNNVTHIFGNHTLKFGVRFERAGQNDFDQINVSGVPGGTNNQNGRFVFNDSRAGGTGLAIGNAALGLFTSYAEIGQRAFTPYRSEMWESFVQDSWKASEKLRVELGLRYTRMHPYYYSVWRNMAVFDPGAYDVSRAAVLDPKTGNVLSGDRYNGVVIPGDGWPDAAFGRVGIADSGEFDHLFTGGRKTYGEFQNANFQPRIGLAYRLSEKTVLRSGVGSFYARPGVADNVFLGGNPPFQPTVSISDGLADNPGSGERVGFPQFFMTQDPVFKIPSAWNWNVTVEHEVGRDTIVEVGYVGRTGLHLERVRDLNQLLPGTVQANPGINRNYLRPYAGFCEHPHERERLPLGVQRAAGRCEPAVHRRAQLRAGLHLWGQLRQRRQPPGHPLQQLRRLQFLGLVGFRHAPRADPQQRLGGAVLQELRQRVPQERARRLDPFRRRAVPDRHAAHRADRRRFRRHWLGRRRAALGGFGRSRSVDGRTRILGGRQRRPSLLLPHDRLERRRAVHGAGGGDLLEDAVPQPVPPRPRLPELEPGRIQELLDHGATESVVPRGVLQLAEPSQSRRRGYQSAQRDLRPHHVEEQRPGATSNSACATRSEAKARRPRTPGLQARISPRPDDGSNRYRLAGLSLRSSTQLEIVTSPAAWASAERPLAPFRPAG